MLSVMKYIPVHVNITIINIKWYYNITSAIWLSKPKISGNPVKDIIQYHFVYVIIVMYFY